MKKISKNQIKKYSIAISAILSTVLITLWFTLMWSTIKVLNSLIDLPSEYFTPKVCFLGLMMMGILFWVVVGLLPNIVVDNLKDLVDNLKEDKNEGKQ